MFENEFANMQDDHSVFNLEGTMGKLATFFSSPEPTERERCGSMVECLTRDRGALI